MREIAGTHYLPGSANGQAVSLSIDYEGQVWMGQVAAGSWGSLKVSDRVGSMPRRIYMADGSLFETDDNDAVDEIQRAFGGRQAKFDGLLNRLETGRRYVVAALAAILVTGYLVYTQGIPFVAYEVAQGMPQAVLDEMGDDVLGQLDTYMFKPTTLSPRQQAAAQTLFDEVAMAAEARGATPGKLKLQLRAADPRIGANAFALPGGDVVMTDALWQLGETDGEVAGVLAHEIGHAYKRHNVQLIVRSGIVAFSLAAILGDTSGIADLLVAAPAAFLSAEYSRGYEAEADAEAVQTLHVMGINPNEFGNMLGRLSGQCDGPCPEGGFLSTHPPTDARKEKIAKDAAALGYN